MSGRGLFGGVAHFSASSIYDGHHTICMTVIIHDAVENEEFNAKEKTHVRDPLPPDNYPDARTIRRWPHRLRSWPLEALWQQRRRVPQGPSAGARAGRRHGRLRGRLGTPALRLV